MFNYELKDRLISRLYFATLIISFPLLLSQLARFIALKRMTLLIIVMSFLLVLIILYSLKRKIHRNILIISFMILYYIGLIIGFFHYGIQGAAVLYIVLLILISISFFRIKTSVLLTVILISTYGVLGYFIEKDLIKFTYDIIAYQYSTEGWLNNALNLIVVSVYSSILLYTYIFEFRQLYDKNQKTHQKFLSLIENQDHVIFHVGTDQMIIDVNTNFCEMVEMEKEDVVGRNIFTLVDLNLLIDGFKEQLTFAKENVDKLVYTQEYVDKKGRINVFKCMILPQLIDQKVSSYLFQATDITDIYNEQAKREEVLLEENRNLGEALESKDHVLDLTMHELANKERLALLGDLVAGFTHEINTPLGVAVTAASFAENMHKDIADLFIGNRLSKKHLEKYLHDMSESIEIVNGNLYTAAELIKNFKVVSLEQSLISIQTFDFHKYIKDLVSVLKHEYKRTHHKILVDDRELIIKSYPGVYSQIFTNLIMNSLRHGFKNMDEGTIQISGELVNNNLMVEYRDNGKGIPDDIIDHIFDKFFTTEKDNGGTGLGLSITRDLIRDDLNGHISCSSTDKGVVFTIFVPNVAAEEEVIDE